MRVRMTDDDARRVDALLDEDAQLCRGRPADCTPWVVIAMPVCSRRARRRPMDALLLRADPRLVGADLADDSRPDARCPGPVLELAHQLGRQVVDAAPVDRAPRPGSTASRYQPQPITMLRPVALASRRSRIGIAADAPAA